MNPPPSNSEVHVDVLSAPAVAASLVGARHGGHKTLLQTARTQLPHTTVRQGIEHAL